MTLVRPSPEVVGDEVVERLVYGLNEQVGFRAQMPENQGLRLRRPARSHLSSFLPLASGPRPASPFPLHRRRLPSSLVPRSSVQAPPRPFGSLLPAVAGPRAGQTGAICL